MQRTILALVAGALVLSSVPAAGAEEPEFKNGSVFVDIDGDTITMGNPLVERTWSQTGFGTTSITHKDDMWSTTPAAPDFRLYLGANAGEDLFAAPTGEFVRTVTSEELTNGLEITLAEENTAAVYVIEPHEGN